MKEWQIRQQLFHQIYQGMDLGDDLSEEEIIEEFESEKIIQRALSYPIKQTKELYYPGKAYAIGIIFAKLIEHHFNEDFYECLNNENLLYGNDPYFKKYEDDKDTYDKIIENFPFDILFNEDLECSENFLRTYDYFLREFLLHDDNKHLLPS